MNERWHLQLPENSSKVVVIPDERRNSKRTTLLLQRTLRVHGATGSPRPPPTSLVGRQKRRLPIHSVLPICSSTNDGIRRHAALAPIRLVSAPSKSQRGPQFPQRKTVRLIDRVSSLSSPTFTNLTTLWSCFL